jgi:hypothetical protein
MLHNQNNGHHQQENDDHPVVPCIVHEDGVHLTFALEWNELFVCFDWSLGSTEEG